jgi:hypothetical protein
MAMLHGLPPATMRWQQWAILVAVLVILMLAMLLIAA